MSGVGVTHENVLSTVHAIMKGVEMTDLPGGLKRRSFTVSSGRRTGKRRLMRRKCGAWKEISIDDPFLRFGLFILNIFRHSLNREQSNRKVRQDQNLDIGRGA